MVIELHQDEAPSCPESIARALFYGTTDQPTLIFDGDVRPETTGFESIYNVYAGIPMPLYIGIHVTKTGNNFDLTATVTRDGDVPASGLKIYCAVTETFQYDGRTLYNVLRDMYPVEGTDFSINDGQTKDVNFSGTLDGSWNVNNLEWAVWVQDPDPDNPDLQVVYGANKAAGMAIGIEPTSIGKIKAAFN
ncbi:MAG: hypothetical protein JSW52_05700 [Candidatus Coatesbacteria bacterium]|nr:MAG: hypothetical protein JSW52_05700 [Candidatus Coatesbacteria bacterium]